MTAVEPVAYRPAQNRVIDAAVDLFAANGVGGTSLQMIADALGVTKAAVYHQFRTKDEIVIAVVEADMAHLTEALDAAEAEADRPDAVDLLLTRLIDLAVEHRHMVPMLQSDPVVMRLLAEHEPFRVQMDRLHALLVGGAGGDDRVEAAMLAAAINGAASHPLVAGVDDDTLRSSLLGIARRFVVAPD